MKPLLLICASLLVTLPGCGYKTINPRWNPPAPGMINHVVFIDLQDSADADELIADCYVLLRITHPTSGYAGRHYDIGRTNVLSDYDVGFFIAFDSEESYWNYLENPAHVALVEKWKPRWDSILIYDVGDSLTLKRGSAQ